MFDGQRRDFLSVPDCHGRFRARLDPVHPPTVEARAGVRARRRAAPVQAPSLCATLLGGAPYILWATVAGNSLLVNIVDISLLSDDELWNRTVALARAERASTYELVVHLAEVDRRHISEKRNACSLFEVCTHQLGMTEGAAYRRIRAARAIRAFPPISVLLRDGKLTVETVALLHPILDQPDAAKIVAACAGLKKWQVEAFLANRQAEKPRRDVIRFCGPVVPAASTPQAEAPEPMLALAEAAPSPRPTEERRPAPTPPRPTLPRSIRVTFSADHEFHQLMRRAQQLLRHKYPDGRLEGVLKDALVALLRRKDRGFRWNA